MMRMLTFVLAMVLALPAWSVEPDEMLDDPVLEERARDISKGLRCLVCRNENIDESNADLARDLRILLRELLLRQQLMKMEDLALTALEGSGQATDRAAVEEVLTVVRETLSSREQRLDYVWRAALEGLGENRRLAEDLAQQANGLIDVKAGNAEVVGFIVDRYGEFVLLKPTMKGANLILWIAAPVMLITALGVVFFYIRRRASEEPEPDLDPEEQARLKEILGS